VSLRAKRIRLSLLESTAVPRRASRTRPAPNRSATVPAALGRGLIDSRNHIKLQSRRFEKNNGDIPAHFELGWSHWVSNSRAKLPNVFLSNFQLRTYVSPPFDRSATKSRQSTKRYDAPKKFVLGQALHPRRNLRPAQSALRSRLPQIRVDRGN